MNASALAVAEPASALPALTRAQSVHALVPQSIEQAIRVAEIMAAAKLIPDHLKNAPGDCLLVVMQAQRWGMDPTCVAQATSVVRGKLCYEGKLVQAALYALGVVEGRLRFEYTGEGLRRGVTVTGRIRGDNRDVSISGTVSDWQTENGNWKKNPDDMLAYRGTRQWARRYAPEVLLGVYTPDEIEEIDLGDGATLERSAKPKGPRRKSAGQAQQEQAETVEPVYRPETGEVVDDESPAQDPPAPPPADTGTPLTSGQTKVLDAALNRAGKSREDLEKAIGGPVHAGNLNAALGWANHQRAAQS